MTLDDARKILAEEVAEENGAFVRLRLGEDPGSWNASLHSAAGRGKKTCDIACSSIPIR